MANRSYIYVTDDYQSDNITATGLSEYNYNVPAVYLLLIAYDAQAIPSKLFKKEPAIVADFAKGKQLLIDVLETIAALYPEDDTIAEFATSTKAHLSNIKGKYTLLENHEIYVLGEVDYVEQNDTMIAYAADLRLMGEDMVRRHKAGQLSHATLTKGDNDIISDIADELDEIEDLDDFWTDVLYYNPSSDEDDGEDEEEEDDDDDYADIELPKETRVFAIKGINWKQQAVTYGEGNSLSMRIEYDAAIAAAVDTSTYTYNARIVVLLPEEMEEEKTAQEQSLLQALTNVDCKLVAIMHYVSKVEYIFQINAIANFVSAAEKWVNGYNYKAEKERGATRDEAKIISKEGWDFYNEKIRANIN